ncbi:helix-turn-helix transcriptional regulator [Larkinella terrae]|uniref:Helix-turn-helix domain-containing protein n=1 Tax=Larkinella terrae TaxID=2025311 RepID=A0A7K0EHG8_9BACT|nr:helix-turn-helix domain-containing protein [Larkinella terrae]MRS61234.1 hypothetical protein [Larkinella terrae]
MNKAFEEEMRSLMGELKQITKQGAIRSKLLYTVEDVAFLTGFSALTVYGWIHEGRPIKGGKKRVYLQPSADLAERGFRFFPDELNDFLAHFPPAKPS